ncbi:hypothetical protein [Cohnella zeiphila]|uniref:Uncharacterized protein n=1 Tax=Cohnella zeiphila TaxID=2761120 RepID=A0A7X0SI66_9BACL|nr:hypothetical protein [Cohnella zeiphila]MBB6730407.1 hypothetical protein [Cohnella zeiphila]
MKKKWWMMGGTLGAGAALFLVSGFSAMAGTSGYDAYKSAVKMNMQAASMTNQGEITFTDNGKEVLNADFVAKIAREQGAMSLTAKIGNGDAAHAIQVFKQGDEVVFKSDASDTYRKLELGAAKWRHHGSESGPPKRLETVVDALMGHLKDRATVQDAPNGGENASLHLSGSQIPAVVNTIGSLLASNLGNFGPDGGAHADWQTEAHGLPDIKADLPHLTKDVQVRQIDLDAGIGADHYLNHQTGEIVVTGTDDAGQAHRLVISLDFNLSGFNQTVPDTIDLTGKQVEVVKREAGGPPWHH